MFCPQCGAPNPDDSVFCENCGAVLNPDELSIETEGAEVVEVVDEIPAEETPDEELVAEEVEEEVLAVDDLPAEPPPPPPPAPPPPPSPPPAAMPEKRTSGTAIASLVMGIVGWTLLPLIGSILAIVLGYAARNEIRQRPDELTGEGMAIAGLVLGWIMVGLSVLLLCLGGLGLCFFFGLMGASGY